MRVLFYLTYRLELTFQDTLVVHVRSTKEITFSGVASPTIYSRYANFTLLSLLISLEINYFHSQ